MGIGDELYIAEQERRFDDHLCLKCGSEMEEELITEASVPDGDGCANYHDDTYYHCPQCNIWYDEDLDECDKPKQGELF